MAIPKIIHYIQFDGQMDPKKTQKIEKCIQTWKEKLKGYELVKWDQTNFDLMAHPYTNGCMQINRWDLIENYVKAYALENQGGIFLDNEMIVLENFDDLLNFHMFFGFEHNNHITNAIVGAEPNSDFFQVFLKHLDELVESREGIQLDYEGYLSGLLKEKYHVLFNNQEQLLEDNIKVYASKVFINPSIDSKTIWVKAENCKGEPNSFTNQMDQKKRMKIHTRQQAELYRKKQENKVSFL